MLESVALARNECLFANIGWELHSSVRRRIRMATKLLESDLYGRILVAMMAVGFVCEWLLTDHDGTLLESTDAPLLQTSIE